jgi:hypothetical protein
MSYLYTKDQIHKEFADVTAKDKSKKKEVFTNRIAYLKALKEDMIQVPKNFSNLNLTTDQLQNLIDDWSAPRPIDAFYRRIFGMSFAEKKEQEELEYFDLTKNEKVYKKKEQVDTIK